MLVSPNVGYAAYVLLFGPEGSVTHYLLHDVDWYLIGIAEVLSYFISGIAGLLVVGLGRIWVKLRSAWAVMLIYPAICSIGFWFLARDTSFGLVLAFFVFFIYALPIALTYCLIAGVPWRIRIAADEVLA